MKKRNVLIAGAAGRDYHNFLIKYKDNPYYDVKCFTAAQIPGIEKRKFPKKLAGRLYKKDIPIFSEYLLPELIKKYDINNVVLSYSDLSHLDVMHKASLVLANGANFILLGPQDTMIKSKKPVIAICAVRTGAGKSQTSRRIVDILRKNKKKVVVVRHPMPYGNLLKERWQRFEKYEDLIKQKCTIEEHEEYDAWISRKVVVYAGVDYKEILRRAEKEADVIVWDGGNNDFPFFKPDLLITVADPFRAGHELLYYPGETNFRMADVIIINKVNTSPKEGIKEIQKNIKIVNKNAIVIKANSVLISPTANIIRNRKVIVVEDGPTLTHGGMKYGAGYIIAMKYKAKIIDAREHAVGSIKEIFKKYPHLDGVLPAMGYSKVQIKELEATINKAVCDFVVDGTPTNLNRVIKVNKPIIDVDYELKELGKVDLEKVLKKYKLI
ncbi:GTPase [Candidatus Woesearchaeota archaeon]|nr:GTPase [Candidatus Woesearchaeota archaeon]